MTLDSDSKNFSEYQPLIFNKDNLEINIDKWGTKGNNILWIVGNSGSGKTTLSNKLSQKYNAEILHGDFIFDYPLYKLGVYEPTQDYINDYYTYITPQTLKKLDNICKKLKNISIDKSKGEYNKEAYLIIAIEVYNWLFSLKNNLYIFEGFQPIEILNFPNPEKNIFLKKLQKSPLILIRTSIINSVYRRTIRNNNYNNFLEFIKCILQGYSNDFAIKKDIEQFMGKLYDN